MAKSIKHWLLPSLVAPSAAAAFIVADVSLHDARAQSAGVPAPPPHAAKDPVAVQKEIRKLITQIEKDLTVEEISDEEKKTITRHIADMGDDNFRTREKATRALIAIGYKARPQVLEAINSSPDPEIRHRALSVIGSHAKIERDRNQRLLDSVTPLMHAGPKAKDAVPVLVRVLAQSNGELQDAATDALGAIGPAAAPAIPELVKKLKRDNAATESWAKAATALGWIGPAAEKEAGPILVKALKDGKKAGAEPDSRLVEALAGMRSEEAVATLVDYLDSTGSTHTKVVLATAIGDIGKQPEKAIPALDRCCRDSASLSREGAFRALGKFRSEHKLVVPVLARLIEDGNYELTIPAIRALADIGPDAKDALPVLKGLRDTAPSDKTAERWGEKLYEEVQRAATRTIEAIEAERKR